MMTFKIILRTDFIKKDGSGTICLRLSQKRKVKQISLQIYVNPKDWNVNRNVVNKSDLQHYLKNKLIEKNRSKAQKIIVDYFLNDRFLSFAEFDKNFFNNSYGTNSFYQFVEHEFSNKSKMYAYNSLRAYKSQLNKLKLFRKELSFSEIDIPFLQAYKTSLHSHSVNTVYKALSFIKTYLNKAIKENIYTEKNPFDNFKLHRTNGTRAYLTINEVEKLETLYNSSELLKGSKIVLKYFLFACYTGLRFSDIKNLTFEHIHTGIFENKETKTLEITMHKTKKPVRIPLTSKAQKFLPEYKYKGQSLFKVFVNQITNRHLKLIAKAANIEKNLSFHVARHTLATTGLEYGIPLTVISEILGHSNTKITQIYAKVSDSLRIKEMQKME